MPTSTSKPLVSIYIPTKNRYKLLKKAVESCLNQTYSNIEIIVVDDASEDDTQKVMSDFVKRFENITYFRNQNSKGAPYSRNLAIKKSKGGFITGLDDDDLFTPNRIEYFLKNWDERFSFLCSNMFYQRNGFKKIKGFYRGEVTLNLMLETNLVGNQVFIERDKLIQIDGFDEKLVACQDYDLWTRLLLEFGVAQKLPGATYIVNEDAGGVNRITKNTHAYKGYLNSYVKFKDSMTNHQRAARLLDILRIQNKKLTIHSYSKFFKHLGLFPVIKYHLRIIGFLI